jgi:hypothetical protein
MKNERLVHLKLKLSSLAAESRLIRNEENKRLKKHRKVLEKKKQSGELVDSSEVAPGYRSLHDHRTGIVRETARHNHLAYGFLREVPYAVMESRCKEEPDFGLIEKIAQRFSTVWSEEMWKTWSEEARGHLAHPSVPVAA